MNNSMSLIRESRKEVIDMAPAPTDKTHVDERKKLSLDQLAIGVDGWMGCGWLRRGRGQETKQKQGLLCSPRASFFVLFQARKCHCCQSAVKRKVTIVGESPPMSIPSKNWRLSILNFACTRASAHGLHTTGPVSHMQSSGKHLALTRRLQMLQGLP